MLLLGSVLGCDPYSDVREGLDEAQIARFERGQRAATPCWSCHDLTGTSSRIGPGLRGVFGSRAGHSTGHPHSRAMRDSGVIWNERTLDAFLFDGQRLIPGNEMVFEGIPDPRIRSDLIFFLKLATRPDRS